MRLQQLSCLSSNKPLSEADHESNHEREQPSSLREREPQNGIREQLSPQARVASDTGDQGSEHRSDTHTGTSETDGRETGTDLSAGFNESVGELGGVRADGLTGERSRNGGFEKLLTLGGLEGGLGSGVVLEGSADT